MSNRTASDGAKIVLRNMDDDEEERAIEDLTDIGYRRDAIRVER